MSEPYQLIVLIPEGKDPNETVYITHEILQKEGGEVDAGDSHLFLNDTEVEEPEPETVADSVYVLNRLVNWPTLGSITYGMPEGMTTVSYLCQPNINRVQAVKISLLPRAFERGGDESLSRYKRIASKLHVKLGATRTIMDWGITFKGFDWMEEINRLQKHNFVGSYELVDLRGKELT